MRCSPAESETYELVVYVSAGNGMWFSMKNKNKAFKECMWQQ